MSQQIPSWYYSKIRNQGHFKYYSDFINNQTRASTALSVGGICIAVFSLLDADERFYRICENNLCHTECVQFNGS